jgi:hypothetical protein
MRSIRAALAAGLLGCGPALAQPAALAEGARALRQAEGELRDALRRMEEGSLDGSMAISRLRQALNEVERAMLRMPAESRRGAPWETAVKEVSEALQALRAERVDAEAARGAAGEALGSLPALRGAETGSEGG